MTDCVKVALRCVESALRDEAASWSIGHPVGAHPGDVELALKRLANRISDRLPTPPASSESHATVLAALADAIADDTDRAMMSDKPSPSERMFDDLPDIVAPSPSEPKGEDKDSDHWSTCEYAEAWSQVCGIIRADDVDYRSGGKNGTRGMDAVANAARRIIAQRDSALARAEAWKQAATICFQMAMDVNAERIARSIAPIPGTVAMMDAIARATEVSDDARTEGGKS